MTFERECGYWSQFAVISREKLEGCLEGLERLTKPLLCRLSYASPRRSSGFDQQRLQKNFNGSEKLAVVSRSVKRQGNCRTHLT